MKRAFSKSRTPTSNRPTGTNSGRRSKKWSRRRDLTPWRTVYETFALPAELLGRGEPEDYIRWHPTQAAYVPAGMNRLEEILRTKREEITRLGTREAGRG